MAYYQLSQEEKDKNRSDLVNIWMRANGVKPKKLKTKNIVKKKKGRKKIGRR